VRQSTTSIVGAEMYSSVVEIVKELTRVHDEEQGEQVTTIFIFKRKP
jgi:hypothetical protein